MLADTATIGGKPDGVVKRAMSRVASVHANGGLLKVALGVAAAFFAIIVGMLGFWISQQAEALEANRTEQINNGNRLTRIETRLESIEDNISDLRD